MENRGTPNPFNIASATGMPLKVDPITQRSCPYSQGQVDVDCLKDLLEKILVQRKAVGFFRKCLL